MKRILLFISTGLSILGIALAICAARAMPIRMSVGDYSLRTLVTGRGSWFSDVHIHSRRKWVPTALRLLYSPYQYPSFTHFGVV